MNKLIANERAYQTLAASLRGGRLSHALLIEGPAGCGKATFALEVAQAALCQAAPREGEPCGACRDCLKAEKNIHPDILTFRGEGGSRSFHIDAVRAIRQEAHVRPNEAERKALILLGVHEMSAQAQNALLKILEEPPGGVCFILTCENRALLLETILSRVQILPLEVPPAARCAERLAADFPDRPAEEIERAAAAAGGNVGKAAALLSGEAGFGDEAARILCDACVGSELEALAALAKYERSRQELALLLQRMAEVLAAALLHPPQSGPMEALFRRISRLRLMDILAIIEDTAQAVSQNVNGLLLVTGLCAQIRSLLSENAGGQGRSYR